MLVVSSRSSAGEVTSLGPEHSLRMELRPSKPKGLVTTKIETVSSYSCLLRGH